MQLHMNDEDLISQTFKMGKIQRKPKERKPESTQSHFKHWLYKEKCPTVLNDYNNLLGV